MLKDLGGPKAQLDGFPGFAYSPPFRVASAFLFHLHRTRDPLLDLACPSWEKDLGMRILPMTSPL